MDEPPVVDESGDLALSSFGTGQHYGSTAAVPRQRFDEVLISAQVASAGAEPIDETPVSAELALSRPMFRSVEVYSLSADQVRALVVMLGSLLPALLEDGPVRREDVPDGCPPWCSEPHGIGMHTRTTGGVELLGRAFDVQLTQPVDVDEPSVTVYDHEDDITSVTSLSSYEAVELALALLGAAGLAGAR